MKDDYFEIDKESPHTRPMDLSPKELLHLLESEKRCQSINTVRNRILKTGLTFYIYPDIPSSYQQYDYECLPILKAFLNTYSRSSAEDTSSAFLDSLVNQVMKDTSPSFTRQILCNYEVFQNHLLRSQLSAPIAQRLRCIQSLAEQLCVQPVTTKTSPFDSAQYISVLTSLDQVIVELASVSDILSNKPDIEAKSPSTVNDMVKSWCTALQERRNSLYNKDHIIQLECPKDSDIATIQDALNQRLSRTLSASEKDTAQKVEDTLQRAERQIESGKPLSLEKRNEIKSKLREILTKNKEEYLRAVMTYQLTPEFSLYDAEFPQIISNFAGAWFEHTKFITQGLERFLHGLILLIVNPNTVYNQTALHLIESSKKETSEFWKTMQKCNYAPKSLDLSFFKQIVAKATSTAQYFPYGDNGDKIAGYLSDITRGCPVDDGFITQAVLFSTAITLEYFWTEHIDQSIPVMMENHRRYTTILQKYEN